MRFAVIPTYNRPVELQQCIDRIAPQVDHIFVINNGDIVNVSAWDDKVTIHDWPEHPPNLSKLWNIGLTLAECAAIGHIYKVAVLNDDALAEPGWFDAVEDAMDRTGADLGCTDVHGAVNPYDSKLLKGPLVSVFERVVGWAFIIRGNSLKADEDLKWWYGDTALDFTARKQGGLVITVGPIVNNLYPNASTTGVLAEQAGRDRQTYLDKYGKLPW